MTRNPSLSTADIARYTRRGRQLQGLAIRETFAGLAGWVVRTVSGAVGRRATVRLGCSDCGAHA